MDVMPDKKKFYQAVLLLLLLNGLIKPLWIFGIDRPLQNSSGYAAYGSYFALLNLSVVFSFLPDLGLTAFINRQYAAEPERWVAAAGRLLLLKTGLAFFYALLVLLTAWLSGVQSISLLLLLILIQVLNSLFLFLRSLITARQLFATDAWFSIADKTLMLLLCGTQLLFPSLTGPLTIERFLWAQLISTGLVTIAAWQRLRYSGFHFTLHYQLPLRSLLQQAWPYALIVLLMAAHYRLDAFILERWLPDGASQAGIYAAAYRLLDAANMAGYLLASFLLPFIARNQKDQKLIKEVVLNSRHLLLLFSLFTAIAVFMLAPWLQQLLYHNQHPDAIRVLQYCLPALIGYSLVQLYGTVLTATGHIRAFVTLLLLALLLNILLNLFLIPAYGALGCTYAALISHSMAGIGSMWLVYRQTGTGPDTRSLLKYLAAAGTLCLFIYLGRRVITDHFLLLIISGFLYLAVAWQLKLIRPLLCTGLLPAK